MTTTIIQIPEDEKDQIQLEVLEFFAEESFGATTMRLSKQPNMLKRKKNKTWGAVKDIIYSMRNLGLLYDANSFAETTGKVYQLTEKGHRYYEDLKHEKSVS